jgi:hypothetical protein
MSSLEFFCGIVMLVSAAGCLLMLYTAMIIERQRQELSALHQHAVRLTYRARRGEQRLALAQGLILALAVEAAGGEGR